MHMLKIWSVRSTLLEENMVYESAMLASIAVTQRFYNLLQTEYPQSFIACHKSAS
jgi:hypothetical protein